MGVNKINLSAMKIDSRPKALDFIHSNAFVSNRRSCCHFLQSLLIICPPTKWRVLFLLSEGRNFTISEEAISFLNFPGCFTPRAANRVSTERLLIVFMTFRCRMSAWGVCFYAHLKVLSEISFKALQHVLDGLIEILLSAISILVIQSF